MTTTTQPLNNDRPAKASHQERSKHLRALVRARAKQEKLQRQLADADAEVRQLITEGFALGITGQQLAEAAGVSKPRVYQIRDGK